ncbi:MAG: hypothetical protein GWN97_10560, partial [Thermoplasmata archaeon]|nr:hypothetical protein [Thermoplasmata archaeon]
GDRDITMVNVSIYNENEAYETTGLFLDSAARRGPSTDGLYMNVYGGITRPTVFVNFTGVTECAVLELDAYIGPEYYSETVLCAGNDLDVRLVFEDLEIEGYDWADMYIRCDRGYITDYCLQMSIVY